MMLTHKAMQQEAEELKALILNGDCEVPGFFACMWPVLVFILLNYVWADFSTNGHPGDTTFLACLFGGLIYGGRMLFLSLPLKFRQSSVTVKSITRRVAVYFSLLFIALLVSGLLSLSHDADVYREYNGTALIVYITWSAVFLLDMNRYKLSGFVAAFTLLKSRKQGGE